MKSDSQLQQDVSAELKWAPSVNAAHIGVEVNHGIVTLAGQVDSYYEKCNAESAAQRVSGVKALATELKVKLGTGGKRTDADIAESAGKMLEWNASLPEGAVKVMVENGWITLTGDVKWQYQRQSAKDSVSCLMGVVGVSNQIAIKPTLAATAVKTDIEAALNRVSAADAKKIHVGVQGNEVTLTGSVRDWAERETVINSTWGTPGVRGVHDKMTLTY